VVAAVDSRSVSRMDDHDSDLTRVQRIVLPATLISLLTNTPAVADVISDWNEAAKAAVADWSLSPASRVNLPQGDAQVALAMFEAVNAIDRQDESYLGLQRRRAPPLQKRQQPLQPDGPMSGRQVFAA
jgi:hypothetical protein